MGKFSVLLLACCLLCTTYSFSQGKVKGSIKGTLVDTVGGHQVLSNASVSLTALAGDSTDGDFLITDKKGSFLFKNVDAGSYRLILSYEGYDPITKIVRISDSAKDYDFANMYMQRANAML